VITAIRYDLLAGRGNAGGIGEREIALAGELLGRTNGDLARRRPPVIVEGVLLQLLVHATIL
jgi:hypothetical protein